MTKFRRVSTKVVVLTMVAGIIVGCATSQHYSSSVVQYLYPDQKEPIQSPDIPVLSLPLKVGIAFVPATIEGTRYYGPVYLSGSAALTEKEKMSLMQEVASHFKKYEFVKSIQLPAALASFGAHHIQRDTHAKWHHLQFHPSL